MNDKILEYVEIRNMIQEIEFANNTCGTSHDVHILEARKQVISDSITDEDIASLAELDGKYFLDEIRNAGNFELKADLRSAADKAFSNYVNDLIDRGIDYQKSIDGIGTRVPVSLIDDIAASLLGFNKGVNPPDIPTESHSYPDFCTFFGNEVTKRDYSGKWIIGNSNEARNIASGDGIKFSAKYLPDDVRKSQLSVLHELGHAKLEEEFSKRTSPSATMHYISLTLHEAHAFMLQFYSRNEHSRTPVKSERRVFNSPHFYNEHIIARHYFEKEFFANPNQSASKLWKAISGDILGYELPLDMDVHWINGYFGYFPSYMIAHVIAAQLGEHGISFAKDIELLETMSSLDYVAVVTGEKLNPDYFKRIWEY